MIKNSTMLREMEEKYIASSRLPFEKALAIVEALWREGVSLGVLPPKDPMEGVEVDVRVARILNACSRN
ncbi:MAG: hypothetical protein FD174_4250 [Geobacteraceae bacterium]|nr:MAG: hypothetical protein FD174_4250 [Geobacteraceae bacterium]